MTTLSLSMTIDRIAAKSRVASIALMGVKQRQINKALRTAATMLSEQKSLLRRANAADVEAARSKGISSAMIDRLTLSDKALNTMVAGLNVLRRLPCPVGTAYDRRVRPNKLVIYRRRVPIGVVAIIYESRPNVTVDAAAICLKSQNAVILRGGSEAFHTNVALARILSSAVKSAGLPADAIQLIPTTDRQAIDLLLTKTNEIDLVIPRGGEGLIRTVVEKSRIPVIKHYKGVCHVYVSRHADMKIAVPVAVNAKVQRPAVCNAMETLLLDARLPDAAKKACLDALLQNGVSLLGDARVRKLCPVAQPATEADWHAEYLDLRLAVRVVDGVDEAIEHINRYGSHHTDAIVSRSAAECGRFVQYVDSSSVMVNASTRFSDGGEFGMGCEIGISTDKLHARGPMAIDELTTYKWIVEGTGQVRK